MGLSVGGLMSGIDTEEVISQLMKLERRPLTMLQQKEADYQVQLTTYASLRSALSTLKSAAEALSDPGEFIGYQVTVAHEELLTATVGTGALAGTYSVTVQQLAQSHKLKSDAFDADEAVGAGTIHLQVGEGEAVDIAVSSSMTLDDVAESINKADAGVAATVINDGTSSYLSVFSKETGENNSLRITVTEEGTDPTDPENQDNAGLSRLVFDPEAGVTHMTETQAAADALLTVDGISNIRRSSNTIDDVIPGVTLDLLSAPAAPDNTTTVRVSTSWTVTEEKVRALVDAYNEALQFLAEHQAYNADTGTAGDLLGDSTASQVRSRLRRLLGEPVEGAGAYQTLSDVGVRMQRDGTLSLDTSVLVEALNENADAVTRFFSGDGDEVGGFAQMLTEQLDQILSDKGGLLTSRTQGIQRRIADLQEKMTTLEDRLSRTEERYRHQFNALEEVIARYQSTADFLSQHLLMVQSQK